MYECYVYHTHAVSPLEARRGSQIDLQRLELQMVVNCHVNAERGTQLFWESSHCI